MTITINGPLVLSIMTPLVLRTGFCHTILVSKLAKTKCRQFIGVISIHWSVFHVFFQSDQPWIFPIGPALDFNTSPGAVRQITAVALAPPNHFQPTLASLRSPLHPGLAERLVKLDEGLRSKDLMLEVTRQHGGGSLGPWSVVAGTPQCQRLVRLVTVVARF